MISVPDYDFLEKKKLKIFLNDNLLLFESKIFKN